MIKRKARIAQAQAEITRGLTECEDCAAGREVIIKIRHLRKAFAQKPIKSLPACNELAEMLTELKPVLMKNNVGLIEIYLSRLDALIEALHKETDKRGVLMALLSKVKSVFSKEKETSQDAMIREREQDAERKIFALQKKIAELSAERQNLLNKIEEKVRQCASLQKDSADYSLLRQQALILRPRISSIDQQVIMHVKMLESNAKYHAMLESGRTTFELREFMPDPTEADVLMKLIADETYELAGDAAAYSDSVNEYGAMINSAIAPSALAGEEEFDQMVEIKRHSEPMQTDEQVNDKNDELILDEKERRHELI